MELNPNHPVTKELREEWHKIAALMLWKAGKQQIVITTHDIMNMLAENGGTMPVIVAHAGGDEIKIMLLGEAEARAYAKRNQK